ncbi:MAG TPA: AAA family ATPase [Candidatus Saccharimonadales bacterium]
MILDIKLQNFQSMRDSVNIDFTVGKQAPDVSSFVALPEGEPRASLIQAFMGANGSGKTTSLRAIALVRWMLVASFSEDNFIPVRPFAGGNSTKTPTSIEVTFSLKGRVHIYGLLFDDNRVYKETLSIRTLSQKRLTVKTIFEREWNDGTKIYSVNDKEFKLPGGYWTSDELKNTSLIAAASRFGNDYAKEITDYWWRVSTNIDVEERFLPYQIEAYRAARYYDTHPKKRKSAETDIKKYDLGIEGFGKNGKIKHTYGDTHFDLEVDQESSGTLQILVLNRKMERALKDGGVVVIDELDAYLHPLITKGIIGKFTNPKINIGGAQLIFSTHDVAIFDLLSKYEIQLVSKSKGENITTVKRLDTFPGVRNTENIKKKYLNGDFGGIPEHSL